MLRATPGLDRGRSNNALTPLRALARGEIAPALRRVEAFAARHGIAPGIQVSPEHVHGDLLEELDARGWSERWPALVMVAAPGAPACADELIVEEHASAGWLGAWAACEGRSDIAAHAETVFALLRGRAWFARLGDEAVAIGVPGSGLLGLFCIAVHPQRRRQGLGAAVVGALRARVEGATPYLQVEAANAPAIALYRKLGFREVYRYRHRVAPA